MMTAPNRWRIMGSACWRSLLLSQQRQGTTTLPTSFRVKRKDTRYLSSSSSSSSKSTRVSVSDLDEPASTAVLQEKLLKATFQRVNAPPVFPWRHSPEVLPRLDPTSPEFEEKGQLLGGNINTTHPLIDELAAAWFFMNVPLHELLFFRHWQADLAESMSWAFVQGVAGILSNVYRVPMKELSEGDGQLDFDYSTLQSVARRNPNDDSIPEGVLKETDFMIEESLRKLYEGAHEFGKHQMQVRLDCRPTSAKMKSLFVFPFLSRESLKINPRLEKQYQELLEIMSESPREAIPMWHSVIEQVLQSGRPESTVICQVLVDCDEVFWVKDISTGTVLQGDDDETFRKVSHLVRFEMVVEAVPREHSLIPFQMKPGNWQITDIDDHLGGNLML